jgi:hypothetical protein
VGVGSAFPRLKVRLTGLNASLTGLKVRLAGPEMRLTGPSVALGRATRVRGLRVLALIGYRVGLAAGEGAGVRLSGGPPWF